VDAPGESHRVVVGTVAASVGPVSIVREGRNIMAMRGDANAHAARTGMAATVIGDLKRSENGRHILAPHSRPTSSNLRHPTQRQTCPRSRNARRAPSGTATRAYAHRAQAGMGTSAYNAKH
jgi:hypothetical protein